MGYFSAYRVRAEARRSLYAGVPGVRPLEEALLRQQRQELLELRIGVGRTGGRRRGRQRGLPSGEEGGEGGGGRGGGEGEPRGLCQAVESGVEGVGVG